MTLRRIRTHLSLGLALLSGCAWAAPLEQDDEPAAAVALRDADSTLHDAEISLRDAGLGPGDAARTDAALYPQVRAILERSCAYQRCHAGTPTGAGLSFELGGDHRAMLVGVRACEYDRMPRVAPGDPEHSWLWVKLTAPFRPLDDPYAHAIYFTPPPDWDERERGCRDQTDEGVPLFGQRMPSTAPNTLPPHELELIKRWILAGAPP